MHKILVLIFLIFFSASLAQDANETVIVDSASAVVGHYRNMIPTDSILRKEYKTENTLQNRKFRDSYRNSYKDPEYDYQSIKPKESLLEKFKKKLTRFLNSIFGEIDRTKANFWTTFFVRIFAIIIIGFLLYLLINYLISKEGNWFFSKRNEHVKINAENIHENIHEISFAQRISEYEAQKNYRFAVRYQFLQILKKLADKKLIEWNPEKTNRDYLYELKNENQKREFEELVRIFDHVWYGEFEINEHNYTHFRMKFQNFKA